ncbi:hypothetical protein BGZ47_009910 [Haplosporangium gracile]|nr:hypothetical protein BGZ47_009910 [Haplosporangium gracile]
MDNRNKHPLAISEIVFTISKLIPLWAQARCNGQTVWYFRPKDLVAASAVNRLLHILLTPILWTVFAYPTDNSHNRFLQSYAGPRRFHMISDDVIKKNSRHFRYLDLSLGDVVGGMPRKAEQLQLSCTRLQELRVSSVAYAACIGRLIQANLGLRLLQWNVSSWTLNPVHLHHIWNNNADTLKKLELGTTTIVPWTPPMRSEWDALDPFCPRVSSIKSMYSLVRAFPALETLKIGYLEEETDVRPAENSREFCPNL